MGRECINEGIPSFETFFGLFKCSDLKQSPGNLAGAAGAGAAASGGGDAAAGPQAMRRDGGGQRETARHQVKSCETLRNCDGTAEHELWSGT